MSIVIHPLIQGSTAWAAFRALNDTASEASAMKGASTKTTRSELLRLKSTGSEKEFSAWVQKNLLDKGHTIEAAIRPHIEAEIGDDLYPVTITNTDYPGKSAALDGMTEDRSVIWECKSWNEAKAECVRQRTIPAEDIWQVVQQLTLSEADRCIYTVSDGTPEHTLSTEFQLSPALRKELLDGWEQFNKDKAEYEHVAAAPQVVGESVEALPAVFAKVTGEVSVQDNFSTFEKALRHFLAEKLITEPKTDQDFADLDLQIKALKKAEAALDAAETQMLAQVQSVNDLKSTKDMLSELVRKNRLMAEKLLASKKEEIKLAIRKGGETALADYLDEVDAGFEGRARLPNIVGNFLVVMKGKRTIASLQDAVDTELARCKIEVNNTAEKIRTNLETLREIAAGYEFLFRDRLDLVLKDNESLALIAKQRVDEHKKAEAEKIEAAKVEAARVERERIEKEAADKKAADEAAAKPVVEAAPVVVAEPVVAEPARGAPEKAAPLTEPQGSTAQSVVTITSVKALLQGVIDGAVPLAVISLDMQALALACEKAGHALPGTTWGKA